MYMYSYMSILSNYSRTVHTTLGKQRNSESVHGTPRNSVDFDALRKYGSENSGGNPNRRNSVDTLL
jgi:hypothetical protein